MTDAEKLTITRTLIGQSNATDELVSVYLAMAQEALMQRRYPRGIPEGAELPSLYDYANCKLAARYFLRRGAEGEIAHNEDGVNRTYGSVNDEDILSEVMQVVTLG